MRRASCLAVVALPFLLSSAHAVETSLTLQSDPGDFIGQGKSYSYSAADGTYEAFAYSRGYVGLRFLAPSTFWVFFAAAKSPDPLSPGLYLDCVQTDYGTSPRIEVSGDGRGCQDIRGLFQVKQATFSPIGEVASLWLVFEQQCSTSPSFFRGELRFNADVQLALSAPLRRFVEREHRLTFPITLAAGQGPIAFTGIDLPEGATLTADGPQSAVFDWTPRFDQAGRYIVRIEGRDAQGAVDAALVDIEVTGETSLVVRGNPSAPIGPGSDDLHQPDATFSVNAGAEGIGAYVAQRVAPQDAWTVSLTGPRGVPLGPGTFIRAAPQFFLDPGRPGINIAGRGGECQSIAHGSFQVRRLELGADGYARSVWVTFAQTCFAPPPGAPAEPDLIGDLRFNALVTVDVQAPPEREVGRLDALEFPVRATDVHGLSVNLSASSLPEGASFTDQGNGAGTFRWTPRIDQVGGYWVTFLGRNSSGVTDSVTTFVNVAGSTFLSVHGAPGERYLTPADELFAAYPTQEFQNANNKRRAVAVDLGRPNAETWKLRFAAPDGQPLTVGRYDNVTGYPASDPSRPALLITQFDHCTSITGSFEIKQLVKGPRDEVLSFWATFEQHCDAAPPLTGEIRYNVLPPVSLVAPLHSTAVVDSLLSFHVRAASTGGGQVTLSATGLPRGATFIDSGGNVGSFRWTPARGERGDPLRVTFHGRDLAAQEDSLTVTIEVRSPPVLSARAFLDEGPAAIRPWLGRTTTRPGAGKPTRCIQFEPLGRSFTREQVDLSSFTLRLAGSIEAPIHARSAEIEGDLDRNGVPEISACFATDDLRRLLASTDQATVAAVVEADVPGLGLASTFFVLPASRLATPFAASRLLPAGGGVLDVEIPEAGPLRILLFDVTGRLVRTIADERLAPAGRWSFEIGSNAPGNATRVPGGVYFYRVETRWGSLKGRIVVIT